LHPAGSTGDGHHRGKKSRQDIEAKGIGLVSLAVPGEELQAPATSRCGSSNAIRWTKYALNN
jgi:hypothetical protein